MLRPHACKMEYGYPHPADDDEFVRCVTDSVITALRLQQPVATDGKVRDAYNSARGLVGMSPSLSDKLNLNIKTGLQNMDLCKAHIARSKAGSVEHMEWSAKLAALELLHYGHPK